MKRIYHYIQILCGLAGMIFIFALVDYFFHSLTPKWQVPEYYFRNKIIYGFLLSIPALYISSKLPKVWERSLVFSLILSIFLQVRYYIEGYPLDFVLVFLLIHFCILYLLTLFMFNIIKKYE